VPLAELRAVLRGEGAPAASPSAPAPARWRPPAQRQPVATGPSLGSDVAAARAAFDAALGSHDVEGAVAAVLAVEEALHAWSGDTLQGREPAAARRTLRAMVVRLGELARTGARDPRTVVEPYVDLLVQLRGMARAGKDYRTSDLVRDRLAEAGVEVRDTPAGMEWHLR
jgi:cysteinyl-tRNA synthetase